MTRRTFVARVLAAMPALLGLGWWFSRTPKAVAASIPAPTPGPANVLAFQNPWSGECKVHVRDPAERIRWEYYDGKQWRDLLEILQPSPDVDREALTRMYVQP